MNDNHRRKDYFFPRSLREAFGNDDTFEPEIRCCSELFYEEEQRRIRRSIIVPAVVSTTLLVAIIYIVNFVLP